jgi:hypothetical protein
MASEAKPTGLSAIARLAEPRFGGALGRFASLAMTGVQLERALL